MLLEAESVIIHGTVAANGGSGAEGSLNGVDGRNADAGGGQSDGGAGGATPGGDGGNGAGGSAPAGSGFDGLFGGGGGGGGAGSITLGYAVACSIFPSSVISPQPSCVPH